MRKDGHEHGVPNQARVLEIVLVHELLNVCRHCLVIMYWVVRRISMVPQILKLFSGWPYVCGMGL